MLEGNYPALVGSLSCSEMLDRRHRTILGFEDMTLFQGPLAATRFDSTNEVKTVEPDL
jgi:hypothetical protein